MKMDKKSSGKIDKRMAVICENCLMVFGHHILYNISCRGTKLSYKREISMSDEILDDVMIKGSCKGKAEAIVNCQCNIENAPARCEQAEHCMFYSYYKCSKQWKRLA